jgi:hypothetical protein
VTPQESREAFIDSQFTEKEIEKLKERGLYYGYLAGQIFINTIYSQVREQGI